MKAGLLLVPEGPAPESYDRLLALARAAEQSGFVSAWVAERRATAAEPSPAPFVLAAALAAETTALRIGAVVASPFEHPVRVAEDAAVLDLLSGGRLLFAASRGSEPAGRFAETIDLLVKSWTHDGFAYVGKHYRIPLKTRAAGGASPFVGEPIEDGYVAPWRRAGAPFDYLSVLPKPIQMPHPPVYLAADDPESILLAARRGWSLLLSPAETAAALREKAGAYWKELARAGREPEEVTVAVARDVCVAPDGSAARRHAAQASGLVGSPDEVFAGIQQLRRDTGLRLLLCRMQPPGADDVLESMRLFAAEVMTRLEM